MAKIAINKKHNLKKKEAVTRLKSVIQDLAKDHSDVISSLRFKFDTVQL